MKRKLLSLALLLGTTACHHAADAPAADSEVLMHNDIDSLLGWLPDSGPLTKEQAHSGRYSLRVDQGHEFSLGYNAVLGQLSSKKFRGVRAEAWAYLPGGGASGKLAVILKDPDGNELMKEYLDLAASRIYGKWVKIDREINFPATAGYNTQLVLYIWNAGGSEPTYVDDLRLIALR